MEFPSFSRERDSSLSEIDLLLLQLFLLDNPNSGTVIRGSGGIRKLRWSSVRSAKGKRGSLRILYYLFDKRECWLITMYTKSDVEALTRSELEMIRQMIERERTQRVGR